MEAQRIGEMVHRLINPILPAEMSFICAENALVHTGGVNTNTIIRVTFGWM